MALKMNETFNIVSLTSRKHLIRYKQVFTMKVKQDGIVIRLKAQLMAKEYAQKYGVDYSKIFPLVAKHTCMRLFIFLATSFGQPIYQLDVQNAFLHGDLLEKVYMEQPLRFVAQGSMERFTD